MNYVSQQISDDLISPEVLARIVATNELGLRGGKVSHLHANFNGLKLVHDIPQAHQPVWILGTENPHRLVSLWDIVNQFQAIEICVQMGNFATTEAQFVRGDYSGEHFGRNQIIANLLAHIIHVSRAIEEAGLTHDVQLFNAMQKRIAEGRLDDSALASEARNAKAILLEALRKLQFLYVATDRIGYLDQDALDRK